MLTNMHPPAENKLTGEESEIIKVTVRDPKMSPDKLQVELQQSYLILDKIHKNWQKPKQWQRIVAQC